MGGHPGRTLIAARALRKTFGVLAVLRGVDLDVAAGESLAILGANGAGKSTLLRLLACISRASGGSLRLFDTDCHPGRPTPGVLGRIGFLGHDPLVYRDLTPRQNLEFYARFYAAADRGASRGDAAARVGKALAQVGLAHLAERPTHTLSRGTLQRLAIARATLHDPELLLLDEPFNALDQEGSELLVALLEASRSAGRTAVFVTHDLARVARLASRAVILARGGLRVELAPVPQHDDLAEAYRQATGFDPDDVDDRP